MDSMWLCEVRGCGAGICDNATGACICASGWEQSLEMDFENELQIVEFARCDYLPWFKAMVHLYGLFVNALFLAFLKKVIKSRQQLRRSILVLLSVILGFTSHLIWLLLWNKVRFLDDVLYSWTWTGTLLFSYPMGLTFVRRYLQYLKAYAQQNLMNGFGSSFKRRLVAIATHPVAALLNSLIITSPGFCIPFLQSWSLKMTITRIGIAGLCFACMFFLIMSFLVLTEVIQSINCAIQLNTGNVKVLMKLRHKKTNCVKTRKHISIFGVGVSIVGFATYQFGDFSLLKYMDCVFLSIEATLVFFVTFKEWTTGARRAKHRAAKVMRLEKYKQSKQPTQRNGFVHPDSMVRQESVTVVETETG